LLSSSLPRHLQLGSGRPVGFEPESLVAIGIYIFIDPQLLVVILPCANDGNLRDTAFVIPAADVPAITTASLDRGDPGYQGSFRLEPLAAKMRPFAVPMERLGDAVLDRLFPGRRSDPA
jgi:hypothetical protein